ncbi:hypothetical protein JCM10296v2_001381 [Rhodotorula toruloides]
MLADISNQPAQHPLAAPSSPASKAPNKRSLALALSSEGDALLPSQLRLKRQFASASSSPAPGTGSSSPFFQRTHLDTFYAPTSPTSSTYEKHPLSPARPAPNASTSLPPSSPSFGLSSSTALNELAKVSVLASEVPAAPAEHKSNPDFEPPRVVHLERDTVLYFGRKAKKALSRSPLNLGGGNRLTHVPIILPKSAKNASRIHCSARIVSAPSSHGRVTVEVRVTGQNGMKIDGKVRRSGSVVRLEKRAGESVRLKFWGWDAELVVAESEVGMSCEEGEAAELGDLPSEVEEEEEDDVSSRSKRRSRPASRAASPALSFCSDDHGLSPQQRPTHLPTSSPLSPPPSLPPSTPSASSARAASLTRSLNLDLPGLIASSIVFHSRSTVAVDEIIHALLRETGSMWDVLADQVEELKDTDEGERRAVEAWRGEVERVLSEEEMFGKIDNTGLKDASGHPLPPYYFYIPDSDPAPDRVAALEPFVKRVRGARTKKQARYFWAKPSLRRNR